MIFVRVELAVATGQRVARVAEDDERLLFVHRAMDAGVRLLGAAAGCGATASKAICARFHDPRGGDKRTKGQRTDGQKDRGRTCGLHRVILGVFDPLVSLHAGVAQRLAALHAEAGGRSVVLAAGAALHGVRAVSSEER